MDRGLFEEKAAGGARKKKENAGSRLETQVYSLATAWEH